MMNFFKSLQGALSSIMLIMLLVVLGGVVIYVSISSKQSVIATETRNLQVVNAAIGDVLQDFLGRWRAEAQFLGKSAASIEFLDNDTDATQARICELLKNMTLKSDLIEAAFIFDMSGKTRFLYSQGEKKDNLDLHDRKYVKEALGGAPGELLLPFKSRMTGNYLVAFGYPVMSGGKVIGGVAISISAKNIMTEYIDKIKVGGKGYPYVLSDNGIMVMHPDREMIGKDMSAMPFIKDVMAQNSGFSSYAFEGKDKIQVWKHVPDSHWIVSTTAYEDDLAELAIAQRKTLATAGLLAGIIMLGTIVLFMRSLVVKPIGILMDYTGAVAKGDFSALATSKHHFELEKLTLNIRSMVVTLQAKISESDSAQAASKLESEKAIEATMRAEEATHRAVSARSEGMLDAANKLEEVVKVASSASEELTGQIEQSSRGADEQSHRVSETATAMEEMNATVLEVARNASQAAQTSDKARQEAQEGEKVVGKVVLGIGEVRKQALELKDDMSALGKQAEGIGQIMSVISDIADQTNLLALNAAIEAARAGEAGRGFAVVADEVRKLAEKTMIATKEVGDAILGIQDGTRKNIGNVDRAASTIEDATALANTSGEFLRDIVLLVDQASDQVRSIATASEQQSAASEEINRSIEQVAAISTTTVQTMGQASHAVTELTQQVHVLRDLIEEMEVGAFDEFLDRWRAESSFIAKNALSERYLTQDNEPTQQAMSAMLKDISLKSEFIEAAFIFDTSGKTRLLFNQGKEGPSLDLHERPYVKDALAGRAGASPAPFKSQLTGNSLMAFSSPVFNGQKVAGGVAISITLGANMVNYLEKRNK